ERRPEVQHDDLAPMVGRVDLPALEVDEDGLVIALRASEGSDDEPEGEQSDDERRSHAESVIPQGRTRPPPQSRSRCEGELTWPFGSSFHVRSVAWPSVTSNVSCCAPTSLDVTSRRTCTSVASIE